jgi:ribonuclease P/MRP protein subunit RPP40
VKLNNQYSDWLDVEAGEIQGSILGPILFIIFISDINSYIPPSIQLTKYADDLGTYNDYKDTKDDNTQQAIDGVEKWAKDNNMQINTNKTKHMIINQQKNQIHIQPTLKNHTLEQVANYKYLGATINEELDSDEQWNETSKKTNCHIYLIKKLKSMGFKEEILVNVYQSITLSQYLYAAPLLISASRSAKEEMLKQQTRFFKIIGKQQKEPSVNTIYQQLNHT